MSEHVVPDLVLHNGNLHTQDPRTPDASAVAIADSRFVAVGDDAEIHALAGPGTRVVDLAKCLALPGLTDAHLHFYDWVLSRQRLSLVGTGSLSDLLRRVARESSDTSVGEWVVGQGWNETRWPNPRMPVRADLDTVAPDHRVILWRSDLHLAVANSRALQQAGINANTPDPTQGRVDRDDSGRPTGILREMAINMVRDVIPRRPEDKMV
ncbi:MAG: amidohydrolase family protein, partial [Anaerolineae bacterium]